MSSPDIQKKSYRQHAKSAKQLPQRFSRIDESVEEESPDALPSHNIPPQSFVDARSSVMHSESGYDNMSDNEKIFRFSAEPQDQRDTLQTAGREVDVLRETRQDRLRDYLRDRFRPPSDTRSQERRSVRSVNSSRIEATPEDKKKGHAMSFGVTEIRDEFSLGKLRSSPSPERVDRQSRSFLASDSRARQVFNDSGHAHVDTNLKNRMSFGNSSDNQEEFIVYSTPILSYNEDYQDSRFGFGKKTPHIKSLKYMKNVKLGQNQ